MLFYCCVVVDFLYLLSICSQSKEALSTVLACDKDLVWSWHRHGDLLEISLLGLLGTNYSNVLRCMKYYSLTIRSSTIGQFHNAHTMIKIVYIPSSLWSFLQRAQHTIHPDSVSGLLSAALLSWGYGSRDSLRLCGCNIYPYQSDGRDRDSLSRLPLAAWLVLPLSLRSCLQRRQHHANEPLWQSPVASPYDSSPLFLPSASLLPRFACRGFA